MENEEIARVYAKVAMNTLALIKGKEYAMHKNFDEIREWILTGKSKCEFFCLPSLLTNELSHLVKIFPDGSHYFLSFHGSGGVSCRVRNRRIGCDTDNGGHRDLADPIPAEMVFGAVSDYVAVYCRYVGHHRTV